MVFTLPSLPHVAGTDPSSCILDAFRTAIAKRLSDTLPSLTIEQAYTGVDYGKKGVDFTVALPRFRLPEKPEQLAAKVMTNVRIYSYAVHIVLPPPFTYTHSSFTDLLELVSAR